MKITATSIFSQSSINTSEHQALGLRLLSKRLRHPSGRPPVVSAAMGGGADPGSTFHAFPCLCPFMAAAVEITRSSDLAEALERGGGGSSAQDFACHLHYCHHLFQRWRHVTAASANSARRRSVHQSASGFYVKLGNVNKHPRPAVGMHRREFSREIQIHLLQMGTYQRLSPSSPTPAADSHIPECLPGTAPGLVLVNFGGSWLDAAVRWRRLGPSGQLQPDRDLGATIGLVNSCSSSLTIICQRHLLSIFPRLGPAGHLKMAPGFRRGSEFAALFAFPALCRAPCVGHP